MHKKMKKDELLNVVSKLEKMGFTMEGSKSDEFVGYKNNIHVLVTEEED